MGRQFRFRKALALAALAHLGVGVLLLSVHRGHVNVAKRAPTLQLRPSVVVTELDVTVEPPIEPVASDAVSPDHAATAPQDVTSPSARAAAAPSRALAPHHVASAPVVPADPNVVAPAQTQILANSEPAEGADSTVASSSADSASLAPPDATPMGNARLTREQLGLTLDPHLKAEAQVSPLLRERKRREAADEKLAMSFKQAAAEEAGKLGLGPEGTVIGSLERLAQSNAGVADGTATFTVRILQGGKLDFTLVGTDRDRAAWVTLLEQTKRELLGKKLEPPKGSRGIEYLMRVSSRVQMPSGADPGLSVKVFGKELNRNAGKRSNGIGFLPFLFKSKPSEDALAEGGDEGAPKLQLNLLNGGFDVADFSGKHSRIVSARVLKRTIL